MVYSTVLPVALLLWAGWIVSSSDYTVSTLTGHVFWHEYLTYLLFFYTWLYSWFYNLLLNFIFSLPVALVLSFKVVVNIWLGFWLLPIAKAIK